MLGKDGKGQHPPTEWGGPDHEKDSLQSELSGKGNELQRGGKKKKIF